MAWPETEEHTTFAAPPAQEIVPSALLMEVQGRLVDLFKSTDQVEISAIPQTDAAGAAGWSMDPAAPEKGWICVVAAKLIAFVIRSKHRMTLSQAIVKYEALGSTSINFYLYRVTPFFDISTTAPNGSLLDSETPGVSSQWNICTLTTASGAVAGEGVHFIVVVAGAQVGEHVAGVAARVLPQSPQV